MSTKKFCDRCATDITHQAIIARVIVNDGVNVTYGNDLCDECYVDFLKFMNGDELPEATCDMCIYECKAKTVCENFAPPMDEEK